MVFLYKISTNMEFSCQEYIIRSINLIIISYTRCYKTSSNFYNCTVFLHNYTAISIFICGLIINHTINTLNAIIPYNFHCSAIYSEYTCILAQITSNYKLTVSFRTNLTVMTQCHITPYITVATTFSFITDNHITLDFKSITVKVKVTTGSLWHIVKCYIFRKCPASYHGKHINIGILC